MHIPEKLLLAVAVLGTLSALQPCLGSAAEGLPQPSRVQLWLRADAGVELDGRKVVRWKDQSGHGADAVAQPDTAPLWVEQALGGKPALQFDGSRTSLAVAHHPGLNASKGLTLFVVYNHTDGFRLAQKKDRSVGLTKDAWFVTPTGGLGVSGIYHSSTSFVASLARTHLMSCTFDPARAEVRIFRNGDQIRVLRDVPPITDNSDPLYIGKRNNPGGTEGHLAGHIAELLIYDLV
ncbi:MAG: LamG domain-containing protein, partial [Planctomycetes bacterium]|nr:LamG domain-containing protein [Planctomycetota bacterium]